MFGLGGAIWGLDIGDSALKTVKLAKQGAALKIQDFEIIRYRDLSSEPGARREDLVFQALMHFFRTPERLRSNFLVSIPSHNVFSRFIALPPVDKRRVPEIVRYEARQQIPFDLAEVIWDYQPVRQDFVLGEEIEIGLFAVKREVVNGFLSQFAMAERGLLGVQLAPLALYNYVRRDNQAEKAAVVIDIGAQSTDLLILQENKFWLRNLPIASNSFNAILEKKFNVSAAEAENVKVKMAQSKHRHQVFDVLKPVLKDLVAEIQRSIGYYKSLSRDVKFEEVLVMGEGFKLHGLHRFLQEQLQYRVRPLTELRDIQYAGPADREEEFKDRLLGLPVAIGLAIQGLRQAEVKVDLLPEDFVLRRELSKKRIPAVVAAGLLWLTMLFFYVAERAAMSRIKDYQDLGTEQVKKAEALANSHSQAQGTVKMSDLNRYRDLGQCRDYWAQAVAGLVRAIPQNPPVYIDSISLIGGDTSIGAGREGGRMEGPGAPGGAPAAGAPAGAKGFRFRATSSQLYGEQLLKDQLRKSLEQATIYPEKVQLFSSVELSAITFSEARSGVREGGGGKFDLASLGDLTTTVTCLLKPKTDIAADIEKVRQERAAKAAQEPAKAEVAAQGAKEPAKPK